jgi:hypothetical protein
MELRVRSLCFLVFFTLASIGHTRSVQASSDNPAPLNAGMVALVADPQKYDGKLIQTIGFMCLEYEGDALYLHEDDFRYGIYKNAFVLRLSQAQRNQFKNLSPGYVIIDGTVYANGPERWDYAGAIGKITRLERWRQRGDLPAPPAEPPSHCSR